jgi:hypothetical protein
MEWSLHCRTRWHFTSRSKSGKLCVSAMQLSWKDDCVEMVDAGRADCLERCLVQEACGRLPRNCFHCERCHRFFRVRVLPSHSSPYISRSAVCIQQQMALALTSFQLSFHQSRCVCSITPVLRIPNVWVVVFDCSLSVCCVWPRYR